MLARGRDDVDVALEQERRRVAAGEAATRFGRAGLLRVELRLAARVLELRAQELDAARSLPGGFVVSKRMSSRSSSRGASAQLVERGQQPVDLVLGVVVDEARAHGARALQPEQLHDLDRVVVAVPDGDLPRRELVRDFLGRAAVDRLNANVGTRPSIVGSP